MKIYNIKVPIYECKIEFIIFNKFKKLEKYLKEDLSDLHDSCGSSFRKGLSTNHYIFIIRKDYKNDLNTLSHECLHLTNYILNDRDVKVSTSNDEAQTYLLGYIMSKIQNKLNK